MIHYDLNKYSIKPEYFSHLHNVAQVMKKCPTVCVTAQGFTDSRNSNDYNRVLSYRRAKSAVDYLVDNYAIDRSRIKLMYGGEENPMVNSPTSEAHHFMNRRVEFRTCDAVDFDMAPPEGTSTLSSGSSSQPDYYKGNKSSGY
jgi:OOP family OmpA-OmpF porin